MRLAGIGRDERDAFRAEATSGDYDHLLRTVIETVNTEEEVTAERASTGTKFAPGADRDPPASCSGALRAAGSAWPT